MTDLWMYRLEVEVSDVDLVGFDVEANDGHIGKIDESSTEAGDAHLVVDTGFWIFGKKRVIPARAVKQINTETRTVFVDLTKQEIKDAPDHDDAHDDATGSDAVRGDARAVHAGYYDRFSW